MGFADDYVDVATRIKEFREKHPEGCLRPVSPSNPYKVETIGDQTFLVYAAAAYRTAEDTKPGIGLAWEPFPGKTNFTRDSELQNAETSAWGRAIVAALAADTKNGIASADEVRNRSGEEPPRNHGQGPRPARGGGGGRPATEKQVKYLQKLLDEKELPDGFAIPDVNGIEMRECSAAIDALKEQPDVPKAARGKSVQAAVDAMEENVKARLAADDPDEAPF